MLEISKNIQNYPKLFKIIQKYLKNIQNYPYIYIYISMDFPDIDPGASLASSRRDLDARNFCLLGAFCADALVELPQLLLVLLHEVLHNAEADINWLAPGSLLPKLLDPRNILASLLGSSVPFLHLRAKCPSLPQV